MFRQSTGRVVCPFAQNPFNDCYVRNMTSLNIEDTIYYCGGHFEECEIYKKHDNDL